MARSNRLAKNARARAARQQTVPTSRYTPERPYADEPTWRLEQQIPQYRADAAKHPDTELGRRQTRQANARVSELARRRAEHTAAA